MPGPKRPSTSAICFRYIFRCGLQVRRSCPPRIETDRRHVRLVRRKRRTHPVIHGETEIYGFRLGSAAYLTDFSEIPQASLPTPAGTRCAFSGRVAPQAAPHPLDRRELHPNCGSSEREEGLLTHICHDLPHEATNASLPPHVRLSYDGMNWSSRFDRLVPTSHPPRFLRNLRGLSVGF